MRDRFVQLLCVLYPANGRNLERLVKPDIQWQHLTADVNPKKAYRHAAAIMCLKRMVIGLAFMASVGWHNFEIPIRFCAQIFKERFQPVGEALEINGASYS